MRLLLATVSLSIATPLFAQITLPQPGKAVLKKSELRACLLTKKKNEEEAAHIKRDQDAFVRDHEAIKTEQASIAKSKEEIAQQSAALMAERNALNTRTDALRAEGAAAKTDEEKAKYQKDWDAHIASAEKNDQTRVQMIAAQEKFNERVAAFNAKIGDVNARSKAVNERVEPFQQAHAAWRQACTNRDYNVDDEDALKKELNL